MKLSFILTFFVVLTASANVDVMSQKVDLDFKNTELSTVLKSLEAQTGHMVIYSADKVLADKILVSARMKNVQLSKALEVLLKDLPYTFTVDGQSILIVPAPERQAAEQVVISGKVVDTAGQPLVGVTVVVAGTSYGTTTDVNGQFSLRTQPRSPLVLRFSFIGKKDVEIVYAGQSELNITLEDTASEIDQVVVTGYQTIARERVTGATTTVTSDALSARYTPNILDNLEGKVAGLVSYNGKLTIRGTSSLFAETSPLLVIDGLPVEGDIEDLNPYDIESITVLKDAAAAAIYGARASNGIIVVATRRAKEEGKIDVDVSANVTVYQKRDVDYADNFYLTPAQQVDLEGTYYKWHYNTSPQAAANRTTTTNAIAGTQYGSAITPVQYAYYQLAMGDIDQSEVDRRLAQYRTQNFAKEYAEHALRNRTLQQYNIAVRNRGEGFQSNLVINYKHDNAGIIHANENHLNIFYKGSYDMTKWLTVNFGVTGILSRSKGSNSSFANNPFNVPAYYNLFNEDGTYASHVPSSSYYNDYSTFVDDNPALRSMHFNHVEELAYDQTVTDRQQMRYQGELVFKIIDGLTFNTQFIYESDRNTESSYSEADSFVMRWMRNVYTVQDGDKFTYMVPETGGKLASRNTKGDYWTGRAQVNFTRTFCNDHSVDFLAGIEFRQTRSKGTRNIMMGWDDQLQSHSSTLVDYPALEALSQSSYFAKGFSASQLMYGTYIKPFINPVTEVCHRNASGYANLTYTYKGRYNAFVSMRKDYADVYGLATEFRGSPFWSAGVSWNIDREDFIAPVDWVSTLKLRASYGYTGNIHQDATSYMTATTGTTNRFNGLPKAVIESPGNSELSWERTATFNLGVDFSLLDHRLRGTIDWYNKKSDKIFSTKSLESTKGFTSLVMNMANIKNNGLELTMAYDWFRTRNRKGFSWTTSATVAWNRNKVTRVEIQAKTANEVISIGYKEGCPVNSLFSYVFAGLTENGVQSWKAADGSIIENVYIADESPESVVFSGQADPKHTYAMENHFTWNGFSLNVMMAYYGGHKMRVLQVLPMITTPHYKALPSYLQYAWTPDNTDTVVPGIGEYNKTTVSQSSVQNNTDIFVQPADFLKIRNIVLGYDLPQSVLSKIGLNNLSLRFQIDNPKALWTKNDVGVDPETLDIRHQTSYIFGLNFRF